MKTCPRGLCNGHGILGHSVVQASLALISLIPCLNRWPCFLVCKNNRMLLACPPNICAVPTWGGWGVQRGLSVPDSGFMDYALQDHFNNVENGLTNLLNRCSWELLRKSCGVGDDLECLVPSARKIFFLMLERLRRFADKRVTLTDQIIISVLIDGVWHKHFLSLALFLFHYGLFNYPPCCHRSTDTAKHMVLAISGDRLSAIKLKMFDFSLSHHLICGLVQS